MFSIRNGQCRWKQRAYTHEKAFGIEINKDRFDDFKSFLNTLDLTTETEYDVLYSFKANEIPPQLFNIIEHNKEVFGKGIPTPLFHIKPFKMNSSDIQMVGNNTTMKFKVDGIDAIKFFCSKQVREDFYEGQGIYIEVELVVELAINYFGDGSFPQMLIKSYSVKKSTPKINFADLY